MSKSMDKRKIKCRTCIHNGERGWDGRCFDCVYPDSVDGKQYELYEPIFELSKEHRCDYCNGLIGEDGVCQRCGAEFSVTRLQKADGNYVPVGVIQEKESQAFVLGGTVVVTEDQAKVFKDSAENYARQHITRMIAEKIAQEELIELVKSEFPDVGGTFYTGRLRVLRPEFKFGEN